MAKARRTVSTERPPQNPELIDRAQPVQRHKLFDLAVALGLLVSILIVYAQVGGFDFINYDDDQYVYENPHVQTGLTPGNFKWAWTAVVSANWMPVTLLSHLLDGQWFGLNGGGHHLMNVFWHVLSSLLLYAALRRATGAPGLSAFAAFLFALHPLHVQSVAWVSERKDVLSAFFWFLALYAYVRYAERPRLGWYLVMTAAFAVGLMAKPMLVTFPFTLLLLDIWPLRRARALGLTKIILEKLPLFALSGAASVVTYLVQQSSGAVAAIPFAERAKNAFLSYLIYIQQTIWPSGLAFFYQQPPAIPVWQAALAFAVILAASVFAIRAWRVRPYLTVGWLWYLGTLVPVIGFVQVGGQAHADRYMYIPMIGLSVMLTWGAADVAKQWPQAKTTLAAAGAISCAVCLVLAWTEASYWKDNQTLYTRAIQVTHYNSVAENNLGMHYMAKQRPADALPHFEAAVRVSPDFADAHGNRGFALAQIPARASEAGRAYETALRLAPNNAEAHNGLGGVLMRSGDCAGAIPHFAAALKAKPEDALANYNLGGCQMTGGNYAAAVPYFEAAIRGRPGFAEAQASLASSLSRIPGRVPDAIKAYEAVLQLNASEGLVRRVHARLGTLLAEEGRTKEGITHLEMAQRPQPDPGIAKVLDRLRTQPSK